MKKYLLIDTYNLFFRALHTINNTDMDLNQSMCLHVLINMIKKAADKFDPTCLVFMADGKGTWRKSAYNGYKANRLEKLQNRTPFEIERDEALLNVFQNEFLPFIKNDTNVAFMEYPLAEADDMISRFVNTHPTDINIIVSTDNDFVQLLKDNVIIYNTMEDRIITNKMMMSSVNNKPMKFSLKEGKVSVSKTDFKLEKGEPMVPYEDWVDYALFMKCIRGDKSDNIFSAYPGVREKSSSKTVGIREAFEGMKEKNLAWNNFMNATWKDPFGNEHTVKEEYEKNKSVIDLSIMPDDIRAGIDALIKDLPNKEFNEEVGDSLLRFLKKWKLMELYNNVSSFSTYFNREYPKE